MKKTFYCNKIFMYNVFDIQMGVMQMPSVRYRQDIKKSKYIRDLERTYAQSTACWDTFWDKDVLNIRFRDKAESSVVFKRYPALPIPYVCNLDILTKTLLGIEDSVGYNFSILNDTWVLNLRHTEDTLMNCLLNGLSQEVKKQWMGEKEHMPQVNITEELTDLMKVYTDAHEHLKDKENASLKSLTHYMKDFIKISEKREEVLIKMETLKQKMGLEEEEDEDGDDE